MKTLIRTGLCLFALAVVIACSAAQKQAEGDLALKGGDCALRCGVKKAVQGVAAGDAVSQCAFECGINIVTDPEALRDLMRIIAGAQAGVVSARDAGTDAK